MSVDLIMTSDAAKDTQITFFSQKFNPCGTYCNFLFYHFTQFLSLIFLSLCSFKTTQTMAHYVGLFTVECVLFHFVVSFSIFVSIHSLDCVTPLATLSMPFTSVR